MIDVRSRSTTKTYDVAVLIGRCNPFHGRAPIYEETPGWTLESAAERATGHVGVILNALLAAETVVALLGSANRARDTRNPFTYLERQAMVLAALAETLPPEHVARVLIAPLDDSPYDNAAWINSVSTAARAATKAIRPRICLTGHVRDATSEYLTWFPAWDYLPAKDTGTNATAIRADYFAGNVDFTDCAWKDRGVIWSEVCTNATIRFLDQFRGTEAYAYLLKQRANEVAYREKWGVGPFQTVDAVLRKGDHVLMIERGGPEGTGAVALPGGFLEAMERTLDAAAREAVEETGIFIDPADIPAFHAWLAACKTAEKAGCARPAAPDFFLAAVATLKTYLRGRGERFDDPYRSRRGHLITEAYLFDLSSLPGLPRVVGSDDAKSSFWIPISEVRPDNTFEDHAFIIDRMLSLHG